MSADGQTYDTYSYEVDYSDFSNSVENVDLRSYGFSNETLNAEICGKTASDAPAVGQVQALVKEDLSLLAESQKVVEGCTAFSFDGIESGSYKLVANYGSQTTFNITEGGLAPQKEERDKNYILVIAALITLIMGVVLLRGIRR